MGAQVFTPTLARGQGRLNSVSWCLAGPKRQNMTVRAADACNPTSLELGWERNTEMQLGTLIGTGSYGLVRSADLNGRKVNLSWSPASRLVPFLRCQTR